MSATLSIKAKLLAVVMAVMMALAATGVASSDAQARMKADPDSCTDGAGTVVCDFTGPWPW